MEGEKLTAFANQRQKAKGYRKGRKVRNKRRRFCASGLIRQNGEGAHAAGRARRGRVENARAVHEELIDRKRTAPARRPRPAARQEERRQAGGNVQNRRRQARRVRGVGTPARSYRTDNSSINSLFIR